MKKWLPAFIALLLLVLFSASALADRDLPVMVNGAPVSGVVEIDISRTQVVQLTAGEPVTWTSSNRRRFPVNENGLVSLTSTGSFKITARAADGTRRVVSFKVVRKALSVEIKGTASVAAKQTVRLKAAITPSNASNRRLSWSSSDPSVATVNASGTVKTKAVNEVRTVIITAATQDGSGVYGVFALTVHPIASAVTIYLDGKPVNGQTLDIDLASFNSLRLSAVVSPAAASQDVTWTSSSRKTATANGGLIEALRKGTVTVSVQANDGSRVRATCKVKISVLSKSISISGPNTVVAGKSITLKASVLPANAGNKQVTWSSSDPSAASVNARGVVRAGDVPAKRTVTITAKAKDGGSSASYTVTVIPKPSYVVLYRNGAAMNGTLMLNSAAIGSTSKVSAAVYPADAAQGIRWSSSDSRVASVSQDGTITCRGKGKALITATSQDNSRVRCNLYVAVGDFSAMPYYIEVDKANQVVRVYERGDGSYTHLVRRMICSTGAVSSKLASNLYNMNGARSEWCIAADRQHYMQYATRINGSYMFHAVPTDARRGDRVVVSYYNKLGSKASGGCVRLLCADAKWIYENVPNNTFVLVMDGVRNPAEYGAVSAPPITGTWDPTDDNPANPYYNSKYTSRVK